MGVNNRFDIPDLERRAAARAVMLGEGKDPTHVRARLQETLDTVWSWTRKIEISIKVTK
jgi:hypothetical protein